MAYPTGTELAAWMVSQGLIAAAPANMTAMNLAAESAAESWEDASGWSPFLAGSAEDRSFDGPEGRVLFPPVGIVSVETLVIDGSTFVEGTDFWLQHRHKTNKGPYQAIEFNFYVRGTRRAVAVNGVFGYAATIPANVKEAIFGRAASSVIANPGYQAALKREKAGPVEYEYAVPAGVSDPSKTFSGKWDDVLADYRRIM